MSRPVITPEALALAAVSLRHRREGGHNSPSAERLVARIEVIAERFSAAGPEDRPPLSALSEAERAVALSLDEAAAAGDPGISDTFRRAFARHLDAHIQSYGT